MDLNGTQYSLGLLFSYILYTFFLFNKLLLLLLLLHHRTLPVKSVLVMFCRCNGNMVLE